jgi:hypothetical protein
MNLKTAKSLAQKFLDDHNNNIPESSNYYLAIGRAEEFGEGFFFTHIFLTSEGKPCVEIPFAGPPGFILLKSDLAGKHIEFGYDTEFRMQEDKLNELFDLFYDVKFHKKSLSKMKSKYNLNSGQLKELQNKLESTELNKERIEEIALNLLTGIQTS